MAGLGSAATWPLPSWAQARKTWRVGYLTPSSAKDEGSVSIYEAFKQKLHDLGYVEGENLTIDLRRAEGDYARLPALAAELVALAPDVIVGSATPSTAALQRATTSIPIVMSGIADPIGNGFVKSLARPGGNITGTSTLGPEISVKSVELLHAAVPNAKRIALLTSPNPQLQNMTKEADRAAKALGLIVVPFTAHTPADFEDVFAQIHKEVCDALVVISDPRITRKLVDLANEWRLPAVWQISNYADMGGLMSYSADFNELGRQGAVYVDKILRGSNPAELPVQQPTRLELRVNLKTAKALGLTIPDSILARADEVIE
jgi:putative ABC transport system substrate-binding protein